MILVLMVMTAILVFSAISISAVMYTTRGNDIQFKEDDLFYIAESGFEHGYATLMRTGLEADYIKVIDNANVEIKIKEEADRIFRIRSKATKDGREKIVQGVIQDTRDLGMPVNYSELVSKYVVSADGLNLGIQGSITLQHINSKTEPILNPDATLGEFPQPAAKPEDKLFMTPNLKLKHTDKIEVNSMKKLIELGNASNGDAENNSIITLKQRLGGAEYSIILANADTVNIDVPSPGEVLQRVILITSGNVKIENEMTTVQYAHSSIICKELIVATKSNGSINISPQPYMLDSEKELFDNLINEYIKPPSSGGTADDWKVTEMSY